MRSFASTCSRVLALAARLVLWRRALAAVRRRSASPEPRDQVRVLHEAVRQRDGDARRLSIRARARRAAAAIAARTLVGAYEDVARLFPASGYSDKALWQGASWRPMRSGSSGEADRATALRLLRHC